MSYNQKLVDKINSYKSYNKQTKDKVLAQINHTREISSAEYEQALTRLPRVMKSHAEFIKRYNKAYKRVTRLEKHHYAPELNKLHFRGFIIGTPGATTIKGALEKLVQKNYELIKDRV